MFKGKTALVTGGSRGIGKSIALKLAENGANIVVNYARSSDAADEVVKMVEAMGVQALAVQADVSKAEDVERLLKESEAKFGHVDMLINNAGITKDTLLIRMKEADWDDVLDINLKGTFLTTKIFGKKMLKKRTGRVINLTSVVGIMGNAGQGNYAASKAGVIGFTKSVAKEFAPRNITVNAIAPGFIRSDMTAKLGEEVIKNYEENIPLGRMGEPEDIANLVLFLCSENANYITGQVIKVDGGMLI